MLAVILAFSIAPSFASEPTLKITKGAYQIENILFGTKDEFCVNDETNALLSAKAWKAHFEKLGAKCELTDAPPPEGIEHKWSGNCVSPVLGTKVATGNAVHVVVLPAPNGFIISTKSTGDVQATISMSGKPSGACRAGLPIYRPWG